MDYEARKVIEALRSGIPSRTIGDYFGGARTELIAEMSEWLDTQESNGMILTASYGEGKTHMLNTVFSIAQKKNSAVSFVSLSRETPFSNLCTVFQNIARNTYMPNREQPGFDHLIGQLSPEVMMELQLFASRELQTDKLYYLLKAFSNTDNPDIRFTLLADLHGDFITIQQLKKIYKDIFAENIIFSQSFVKTRHIWDYYLFLNRLFVLSGLNGWVILFDEAENIGRLGRKTRFTAYSNMAKFLGRGTGSIRSLFTITNNYVTQVIDGKDERKHLAEAEGLYREQIECALCRIEGAKELIPLTRDEFTWVLTKIVDFHSRAYAWNPDIDIPGLCNDAWLRGYYLRTKIRAVIEHLDQIFQYGDAVAITAGELDQETYQEEIPLPYEL